MICDRITPAWAGKSTSGGILVLTSCGSPPRGRGKATGFFYGFDAVGITPAWAGKRSHFSTSFLLSGDHPRVGGEKVPPAGQSSSPLGSPPRGRGKVLYDWHDRLRPGITPAWAGKSQMAMRKERNSWDHPRVGGEKRSLQPGEPKVSGSPPRGRGKDYTWM